MANKLQRSPYKLTLRLSLRQPRLAEPDAIVFESSAMVSIFSGPTIGAWPLGY